MLEYIILGFLFYSDMSGYDIKQFMTSSTANFYDASFGSIYPMLKKMEAAGRICTKEYVEGGKYRKLHSITVLGRQEFLQWLEQPIELSRDKHTHLVRIFFYGLLKPETVKALIGRYIETMEAELKKLAELESFIDDRADFFQVSTLDFGKGYYEFNIDWCRKFLGKLDQSKQACDSIERKMQP